MRIRFQIRVEKERKATMQNEIVEKKGERQILVFNLMKEELGLDISCVREVLRPQEIHPLPQAPDFIEGVINLRGHIITVIDLRKKFNPALSGKNGINMKAIEDSSKMHIVVCKIKDFIVGLVVDGVSEVISLSEEDIDPTPEVVSMQIEDNYISSIARLRERVIVILNLREILTKEEAAKFAKIKK